jgi:hypothetical protein
MNLDSDYYSSRCKDINGLWLFNLKGLLRHLWVGTVIMKQVLYSKIKDLFTLLGWRCSKLKFIIIRHPHSHAQCWDLSKIWHQKDSGLYTEKQRLPFFLVEKQQKDLGEKVLSCLLWNWVQKYSSPLHIGHEILVW